MMIRQRDPIALADFAGRRPGARPRWRRGGGDADVCVEDGEEEIGEGGRVVVGEEGVGLEGVWDGRRGEGEEVG